MIFEVGSLLFIMIFSVVLHEVAHGWVANLRGDPTAKLEGRLTLNPMKHVDPVGTIILPAFLFFLRAQGVPTIIFGWAKPVPVNFARLKNPRTDMIWVALAGPASNIFLACLFGLIIHTMPLNLVQLQLAVYGVLINLILAVFNMVPIPPLDGSRLLISILPRELAIPYASLERYGILIVFICLYFGLFDALVYPSVQFLGKLLGVDLP